MQRQGAYLTVHLLQMALDRSKALTIELQRLQSQQYPPTGPQQLIKFAIRTNQQISKDLSAMLAHQAVVEAIPSREVEINLRTKTNLLDFLHLLMQYVEGAEIQYSPSTLVMPLRRLLEKQLRVRDFDFIVRASRRYNYIIRSITEGIMKVFSEAGYASLLAGFPSPFFVIDCPISERRNVPIHCMFAHEIGHVLYEGHELANTLLPLTLVDGDPLEQLITKSKWVEELTADALALCLLGPAYFFSFVYFTGPFASMDNPSESHPPDRMRIEFMCNILSSQDDGLAYDKVLKETSRAYIEQWKAYATQSASMPTTTITEYSNVAEGLKTSLTEIMREAKRATGRRRYTPSSFKKDVPLLCENLANGIPPNEIIDDWATGQPRIVKAEAILNAGWEYLISGDDRYAKLLGAPEQWTVTNKLFALVSKGLEYAEIQRRWGRKR